jgi:hypothetical protein
VIADQAPGRCIGKVVKSSGHTDYVVQVDGTADVPSPPRPSDYAVGTFVSLEVERGRLVGVVYDTILLNPEYGSLGPRLSPRGEVEVFSPDYLDEKAVLVGLVVVGALDERGQPSHSLPPLAAQVDAEAIVLSDDQVRAFHAMPGKPEMPRVGYLPRLVGRGGDVAPGLAQLILARLAALFPEQRAVLGVLRDNVAFNATVAVLR